MTKLIQQKILDEKPQPKTQDYRNSIMRNISRLDPDILSFIKSGSINIEVANFSKEHADSIRNEFKFRSELIDWFIFTDVNKFPNTINEIKISIFSVAFDEEKDEFRVGATINRPTMWELFLLDELMRDSALEASDLHGIELSVQAARQAIHDLNCNVVRECSSNARH